MYVDICLSGCLEYGGIEEVEWFIVYILLWEYLRVNDRMNLKYFCVVVVNLDYFEYIDRFLVKR